MKYWKEAATVILAGRLGHQDPIIRNAASMSRLQREPNNNAPSASTSSDYKVLMLQRAHRSSFFAGAQVFPGGGIDEADFSPKWMELFAKAEIKSVEDFGPMINIQYDRPPMIAKDRGSHSISNDLAFRICAIRETFEESGVLLLKHLSHCRPVGNSSPSTERNNNSLNMSDMSIEKAKGWRQRIQKNAAEFLAMCQELESLPDVWSLAEWSNWLTPSDMTGKRYDTMFYLCCMDTLPPARQDEKETIHSQWVTPRQCLAQFAEGEFFLPPPQVYELQRLCRFQKLSELFSFSQQRAPLGCQRCLPVRVNCSNGVLSTLPGDHLYPERPVLETVSEGRIETLEGTIEEHTDTNKPLHRQVFPLSDILRCYTLCNLKLPHGHCTPLPYHECIDAGQSKL